MTTHVKSIAELTPLIGTHLGYSDYRTITQEEVNLFADATGDHQWIHVDPERAKAGPFGGPIAHGYLTLSLIPVLLGGVMKVDGVAMGVNYGTNKVRFTSPVFERFNIEALTTTESPLDDPRVVVEVKDAPKPSCVAQVVFRYYS